MRETVDQICVENGRAHTVLWIGGMAPKEPSTPSETDAAPILFRRRRLFDGMTIQATLSIVCAEEPNPTNIVLDSCWLCSRLFTRLAS